MNFALSSACFVIESGSCVHCTNARYRRLWPLQGRNFCRGGENSPFSEPSISLSAMLEGMTSPKSLFEAWGMDSPAVKRAGADNCLRKPCTPKNSSSGLEGTHTHTNVLTTSTDNMPETRRLPNTQSLLQK